jgi:murein DD-endopeptidase MepM/ murein hydrolase activator NlpD
MFNPNFSWYKKQKRSIKNFPKKAAFWRLLLILGLALSVTFPRYSNAQTAIIRDIAFPIDGAYKPFTDNFGDPRGGGRTHEGTDILADKMTPLVSAVDGQVTFLTIPEAAWGNAIYIQDDEGWEYAYLHINNDTPGTDDGNGGLSFAFAPTVTRGSRVVKGQHIAWVGDSGNAEWVGSHLHFEIRDPSGSPVNAYESLVAAATGAGGVDPSTQIAYDPAAEKQAASTINVDKNLNPYLGQNANCLSGSLIKSNSSTAVYYCGADGKRYVFPNDKIFFSWYEDFSDVSILTEEGLAAVPLGGNVTYRPGVRLIKVQTDPRVYAVSRAGVLRWVTNPTTALQLFGQNWQDLVDDLPDAFFTNYLLGAPIN